VPSLLYWPGTLEPASVAARVTVQDVLPTLAQVASVELLPTQVIDGSARWDAINGESALG
jgi:arylsulfatase A-like enzyme